MKGLPYYKAYPRDFIEGTIGMPFELKGAYRLVLDLIYMQAGRLPDDARYISGVLGCTVKKWLLLRRQLVLAGKINVNGDTLSNSRTDIELGRSAEILEKLRRNGSKGGLSRAENLLEVGENSRETFGKLSANSSKDEHELNKNNVLDLANATITRVNTDTDTYINRKRNTTVFPKRVPKRGCRLPDDFKPDFSIASFEGFTGSQAQKLFSSFKDYWTAKAGKDATKLDWQATWRNWVRSPYNQKIKEEKSHGGSVHTGSRNRQPSFTEALFEIDARLDAARSQTENGVELSDGISGKMWTDEEGKGKIDADDRCNEYPPFLSSQSRANFSNAGYLV